MTKGDSSTVSCSVGAEAFVTGGTVCAKIGSTRQDARTAPAGKDKEKVDTPSVFSGEIMGNEGLSSGSERRPPILTGANGGGGGLDAELAHLPTRRKDCGC
jgi:hypothetical protein